MATTKVPAAIAHLSSSAQFGCSSQTDWRRECDWDPKASEFGVIILLGRVRPGSNCGAENTAEIKPHISRSGGCDRNPTPTTHRGRPSCKKHPEMLRSRHLARRRFRYA